jgi:N-acetylneuraminate lyase
MPPILTGLIPACHTPFDHDCRLNLSVVERQAALYRESGLRGVFVGGTTGEFASLTVDERKALCESWVHAAGDSLRVVVHVGHNAQSEAIALTAHARQAGAAAIAAMGPSFFRPATIEDLIEFCLPIAAEAEPLPFYYYHIPSMSGIRLPMAEFLREARFRMPNLRGLKFSHDDLVDLQGCVGADNGAFEVLYGMDETLLAGVCLGVSGAVGCTYNFAAGHHQRMIRAFETGNVAAARALQRESAQMIKLLYGYGFMAAAKAVMGLMGVDCGPVRPPLCNLTPSQLDALAGELAELDLWSRPIRLLV